MVFVQKKRQSYYLVNKVKISGKHTAKWMSLGKENPTIWYPQLINDKAESVLAKLPDESIDLIVTDPPYGVSFKGHRYLNRDFDVLFNDDNLKFLEGIGDEFLRVLKPNSHCYVFTRWDAYPIMVRFFSDQLKLDTVIIWDKDEGGHGMGDLTDYAPRYEMIMKFSKGKRGLNGKRHPNIIRHQDVRFTGELKVHPTQKPRGLMEFMIKKSSNMGDVVADFYGGSYSVSRAAMRLFRRSIGVELNPQIHRSGMEMVNKDLHNDPEYGIDWTTVKNIQIKNTELM